MGSRRGAEAQRVQALVAVECAMPKMVKKGDLPTKTCAGCGLPFAWRKKWARDWEQVRFCSKRCRGKGVQRG